MNLGRAVASFFGRNGQSRASGVPDFEQSFPGRRFRLPPEHLDFPHAFRLVPSIRFCVELIQDRIASLPLRFYTLGRDGSKTYMEPRRGNIAAAWASANTIDTGNALTRQIVGSRMIHGSAYLFLDRLPRELGGIQFWVINSPAVTVVAGAKRTVAEYLVKDGVGKETPYKPSQILRMARYDPDLALEGLSPMRALMLSYETERDAGRMNRRFYEIGGLVAGWLKAKIAPNEDLLKKITKQFRSRFQKVENMGDPVILWSDMDWIKGGLTHAEMQFIENHQMTLEDILRVYKVPPMHAGLAQGTGLNSDVARVAEVMLYQNAIEPECTAIAAELNERLLASGEFGTDLKCEFDFSGVKALQFVWLEQAEAYQKAVGAPIITVQEARRRLGMSPDPEEGELLMPIGMITESQAEEQFENTQKALEGAAEGDDDEGFDDDERSFVRIRGVRRKRLKVSHERSLAAHTKRTHQGVRRLLDVTQRRRAHERLDVQLEDDRSRAIDVQDLVPGDPEDEALIRSLLEAVIKGRGPEAIAEIALELAFNANSSEVRLWLRRNAAEAITQINATTRARLRGELDQAARDGETLGELHARIDAVFDGRRANALTISRTETTPAFNFASVEAWRQTGVVEEKEWLTARDPQVRESHEHADGQRVALHEMFEVGADRMAFPGEGSVPDENINCRCTVLAVVGERAQYAVRSIGENPSERPIAR